MNRNNGYLQLKLANNYHELINRKEIIPLRRNKVSFYIDSLKVFFKEEINVYLELLGTKIGNLLSLDVATYDMLEVITKDKSFKGVVSNDFRKNDYELVNMSEIIDTYVKDNNIEVLFNDMNLKLLKDAIEYRYINYENNEQIVNKIMDNLKKYFLLDILIGNIDNGKYNYELMESNTDAITTPYYDFEEIFKFTSTRFTASDNNNYDVYDNLYEFLQEETNYLDIFLDMYQKLTPFKVEDLINEVEKDTNSKIDNNPKNIIFLSYSRHYQKIGEVLNRINHNKLKK